jgi:hypothetical protein
LLFLLAVGPLFAGSMVAQTDRFVKFPNGPQLNFTVPMGYSFEARNNSDGSVGIHLDNPVWGIEIFAIVASERDPAVTTREWQESMLINHIAQHLSRARETDYGFKRLTPAKGTGIFCTFTSLGAGQVAAPQPGLSTHVTGGIKTWPGRVVLFHIFSNGVTSAEYQEAFDLFSWSFTD